MWEAFIAWATTIGVISAHLYHLSMKSYAEGLAYEDALSDLDREDWVSWHTRAHYRRKLAEFQDTPLVKGMSAQRQHWERRRIAPWAADVEEVQVMEFNQPAYVLRKHEI